MLHNFVDGTGQSAPLPQPFTIKVILCQNKSNIIYATHSSLKIKHETYNPKSVIFQVSVSEE